MANEEDIIKQLGSRIGHHHLIEGKKYICVAYSSWCTATHYVSAMAAVPEDIGAKATWTPMYPKWFIKASELPKKVEDESKQSPTDSVPSSGQD